MRKTLLLILLTALLFLGCTHPETISYNGYIIASDSINNGERVYLLMWDVTKEEVETIHYETLLANNDQCILVVYDPDDKKLNKFKVGDKIIVSTRDKLDETREVRATKIELDTTTDVTLKKVLY
ncbi:hypothetical protein [Caldalkalibacillus mannanilyticus]|uniref:hypothetical protein n=1 Tax=Caldalkalibacillus mannanilyticus TaxID=1418 RepID=UPI00046AE1A2|nr:hypothetical protein [Caldalkalibacillus mannanilyticus]